MFCYGHIVKTNSLVSVKYLEILVHDNLNDLLNNYTSYFNIFIMYGKKKCSILCA